MKYCRKCGLQLIEGNVPAHKVYGTMQDSMGMSFGRLDSAFDADTGLKNVAIQFYCPAHKYNKFFKVHNDHDQYVLYRGHSYYWTDIKN